MARSRNIKPAFFTNDELAECEPLARLLFIGLWTISDFKGCLEWRPKKIKAQLLPYDECDITKLMINLDKSRFIISYSDGSKVYIKIRKFAQHQHPHPNEIKKGSPIPDCTEEMAQVVDSNTLIINHDKSRLISDDSVSNPSVSLIPLTDSFTPITDTLSKKDNKKEGKLFTLPLEINPDIWNEFEQHRKEINKPMTDLARTKNANILKKITHGDQKYLVDYSIGGRYTGLFPEQLNKRNHNERNQRANTGSNRNLSAVDRVKRATANDRDSIIDITPHGYTVDQDG